MTLLIHEEIITHSLYQKKTPNLTFPHYYFKVNKAIRDYKLVKARNLYDYNIVPDSSTG